MRFPPTRFALLALFAFLTGCQAHSSSPWEFGPGIWLAPGFSVGEGDVTVHPKAGYAILLFDGGTDKLLEVGGQVRMPLERFAERWPGFWIGGEANVSRLSTSYDGRTLDRDTPTVTTNGWSLWALAGAPFGESRWGFNFYGGGGISHYGSQGINLRVGLDVQPWFIRE